MVANLTKTSTRRTRPGAGSRNARRTARLHRHPAHRRLLDLHGVELYAVMSYRVALAVLAVIALIHLGGH